MASPCLRMRILVRVFPLGPRAVGLALPGRSEPAFLHTLVADISGYVAR